MVDDDTEYACRVYLETNGHTFIVDYKDDRFGDALFAVSTWVEDTRLPFEQCDADKMIRIMIGTNEFWGGKWQT